MIDRKSFYRSFNSFFWGIEINSIAHELDLRETGLACPLTNTDSTPFFLARHRDAKNPLRGGSKQKSAPLFLFNPRKNKKNSALQRIKKIVTKKKLWRAKTQRRKESPLPPCKGEFSQLAFNFGNKKFRISPKDFPSQFNSYASKDATPPF